MHKKQKKNKTKIFLPCITNISYKYQYGTTLFFSSKLRTLSYMHITAPSPSPLIFSKILKFAIISLVGFADFFISIGYNFPFC